MHYRKLGNTDITVSEIGFGAWAIGGSVDAAGTPFGWGRTSDDESLAAIRRARELGVTFFDTADSYGFGRSESLLGIVLSRRREQVVIATKVGVVRDAEGRLRKDFSRAHISHAVDASLRRLRTDYIDLYQLHNPTVDELRRDDIHEAMDRLQEVGKIRYWGVSVTTPEEGIEVVNHGWGYALQVLYNVLNQAPAEETRFSRKTTCARTSSRRGVSRKCCRASTRRSRSSVALRARSPRARCDSSWPARPSPPPSPARATCGRSKRTPPRTKCASRRRSSTSSATASARTTSTTATASGFR
jgi:diketogulonate reductase-like aldo/keto reductase